MAFLRFVLPALALAGSALAQCDGPTTTIQNQGDASGLSSCSTVTGDVVIASQAAGTISLDGVQQITGSLTCDGASNLTSLGGSQLSVIGRSFSLTGLTILSTLSFPSLVEVQTIEWQALPALQQLSFAQGVQQAGNITISNTELNTLTGIELMTVGDMNINNNPYLTTVNVNNMANITGSLNFAANSKDLQISFPNLDWARNMTFRNVSGVSMPSLSAVNGSLGFYGNGFSNFTAANLTMTGQDLVFDDNDALTNLSLPSLTTVGGGFQIANNSKLTDLSGMPKLQTVGGAVDFSGAFKNASLPALKDVRGGMNIQTTQTFDCSTFQGDHSSGVVKGTFVCAGAQANPGTAGTKPSGTGSSSSTATKKAAAGRFEVNYPMVMGSAVIVGGLLQLSL